MRGVSRAVQLTRARARHALAMFILWNRKTLAASVADYRRLRTGDWAPPQ